MPDRSDTKELLRLKLRIWHTDCWTLEVTDDANGKLLGHGTYLSTRGKAQGRFTVYGETIADVESLIDAARSSSLTYSVLELHEGFTLNETVPPGTASREIFVEYEAQNSIDSVLSSNGFIRDEPTRISEGQETWTVVTHSNRRKMRRRLDQVREQMDAEIEVTKILSHKQSIDDSTGDAPLTDRQREVFAHAQRMDYYTWPREVTVEELSDGLDISKTTVLEHLRKAEAKILSTH